MKKLMISAVAAAVCCSVCVGYCDVKDSNLVTFHDIVIGKGHNRITMILEEPMTSKALTIAKLLPGAVAGDRIYVPRGMAQLEVCKDGSKHWMLIDPHEVVDDTPFPDEGVLRYFRTEDVVTTNSVSGAVKSSLIREMKNDPDFKVPPVVQGPRTKVKKAK